MVSWCAAYCVNLWSHGVFCLKHMLRDNMFGNNSGIEGAFRMICYATVVYFIIE